MLLRYLDYTREMPECVELKRALDEYLSETTGRIMREEVLPGTAEAREPAE